MQALITTNNAFRLVATKLLSYFSPKAFVGWQSPMRVTSATTSCPSTCGHEIIEVIGLSILPFMNTCL